MTENAISGKSSMNLIPVIMIVLLIISAGYLLLKDTLKLPWFRNDNTIEITRIDGFPTSFTTDQSLNKTRAVITSEEELSSWLRSINVTDEVVFNSLVSNVNFANEILLAVSSDTQEETEGMIRIKRVEYEDNKASLAVRIIQYKPDPTCIVEVRDNILVDIVKVTKTDKKITFDVVKENRNCD